MGQKVTMSQYIKDLKRTNKDLKNFVFKEAEEIAKFDMAAVIAARVRNTGQKATGGNFKPYSTKPTLIGASTFTSAGAANKALGSKAKRKKLEWVTLGGNALAVLEGGYKEIRDIEGRQTSFKDFERTSEMWKAFGVVRIKKGKTKIKIRIGGQNPDSIKKIAENSEREGISIIEISNQEEKNVLNLFEERQFKYLNSRL